MNKFFDKMERKFGRYAIPDLINYFLILYVGATILGAVMPMLYPLYLALDFNMILRGQVWRLFTFILAPYSLQGTFNILFFVISIHIYYLFGHALENIWGAFRFNMYFFGGIVLTILAELILFLAVGPSPYYGGMNYIYQSMFFAFCVLFPEERFMIYFVFPIKAKILAVLDAILLVVELLRYLSSGYFAYCIAILVAMANFGVFYYAYKHVGRLTREQRRTRRNFRNQNRGMIHAPGGITRHKCAICGRTEQTNPELAFRFCSKCNGNYEYCEQHLFTHQHVGGGM